MMTHDDFYEDFHEDDDDHDDVQGSRGKAKQAREAVWEAWGRKLGEQIQSRKSNQLKIQPIQGDPTNWTIIVA